MFKFNTGNEDTALTLLAYGKTVKTGTALITTNEAAIKVFRAVGLIQEDVTSHDKNLYDKMMENQPK